MEILIELYCNKKITRAILQKAKDNFYDPVDGLGANICFIPITTADIDIKEPFTACKKCGKLIESYIFPESKIDNKWYCDVEVHSNEINIEELKVQDIRQLFCDICDNYVPEDETDIYICTEAKCLENFYACCINCYSMANEIIYQVDDSFNNEILSKIVLSYIMNYEVKKHNFIRSSKFSSYECLPTYVHKHFKLASLHDIDISRLKHAAKKYLQNCLNAGPKELDEFEIFIEYDRIDPKQGLAIELRYIPPLREYTLPIAKRQLEFFLFERRGEIGRYLDSDYGYGKHYLGRIFCRSNIYWDMDDIVKLFNDSCRELSKYFPTLVFCIYGIRDLCVSFHHSDEAFDCCKGNLLMNI